MRGLKFCRGQFCILAGAVSFLAASQVCADAIPSRSDPLAFMQGEIISFTRDGVFQLSGHSLEFRLFELEYVEGFDPTEIIGRRVNCSSVHLPEVLANTWPDETVVTVICNFIDTADVRFVDDWLEQNGSAVRFCDPQGSYLLGCPFISH